MSVAASLGKAACLAVWDASCRRPCALGSCGLGIVLANAVNEGGDDASAVLAGIGECVAHEVDAARPPGGVEHLSDRGLTSLICDRE